MAEASLHTNGLAIGTLQVAEWLDEDGEADEISASWLGALKVKPVGGIGSGRFGASLALDGSMANGASLRQAVVAGGLTGGQWILSGDLGVLAAGAVDAGWELDAGRVGAVKVSGNAAGTWAVRCLGNMNVRGNLDGARIDLSGLDVSGEVPESAPAATTMGKLNVAGWIRDTVVNSAGGIKSVAAAGMDGASILAGTNGVDDVHSTDDFAADCLIGSVMVRGVRAGAGFADSFRNTKIAARRMGRLVLQYARTAGDGGVSTVSAETISSLILSDSIGHNRYTALWQPGEVVSAADLAVRIL